MNRVNIKPFSVALIAAVVGILLIVSLTAPALACTGHDPKVSVNPGSCVMDVGQSQTFTANASGGSGIYKTYQWYVGSSEVQCGAANSYNYTALAAGSYSITVKVTDSWGETSNLAAPAVVTVDSALSIAVQPASTTSDAGQQVSLSSTVVGGAGSFSWQWYDENGAISGASGAGTIATCAFSSSDAGIYVTFTDVGTGSATPELTATSNVVSVTVNDLPTVSIDVGQTLDVGQSQTFTATVTGGTGPFNYQWYLNGNPVETNSPTYTYTAVAGDEQSGASIYVNITDSFQNNATSNTTTVTVNPLPTVSINIGQSSQTLDIGQNQTFTATVTGGTGPFNYQWYLNGNPVETNSPTYTYTAVAGDEQSGASIYVNITDSFQNNATSNTTTVTVNPLPTVSINIGQSSQTLDIGQNQTFTATVTGGTGPFNYQWYLNGNPVETNSPTYTYTAVAGDEQSGASIYVNITDSFQNNATSNTTTVTVNAVTQSQTGTGSTSTGTGSTSTGTGSTSTGTGSTSTGTGSTSTGTGSTSTGTGSTSTGTGSTSQTPSTSLFTVGLLALIIFLIALLAALLLTRRRKNKKNNVSSTAPSEQTIEKINEGNAGSNVPLEQTIEKINEGNAGSNVPLEQTIEKINEGNAGSNVPLEQTIEKINEDSNPSPEKNNLP